MTRALKDYWFWFACCLFLVCTFVFLYPYSFDPAHAVSDPGDPLLNISTLWRVQQHLAKGEILDLYEGNYYYPSKNVLVYSEVMLPTAIITWPVAAITGNPVAAYNFAFILNYFLTALFTFILVRRLTGSGVAGIASGLLFTFWHWRLYHPAHLQVLTNQWVLVSLIYLHKYWEDRRLRSIVIAAAFFAVQALSCIYLGLIFSFAVGIVLFCAGLDHYVGDRESPSSAVATKRHKPSRLLMRTVIFPLAVFGAVSGAVVAPPSIAYLKMSPLLEKGRWGGPGADLLEYLLSDRMLFIGIPLMFLVPYGFLLLRKRSSSPASERGESRALSILTTVTKVCIGAIAVVILFRLVNLNVRGVNLGFIPLSYPLYVALLSGATSVIIRKLKSGRFMRRFGDLEAVYFILTLVGLVLSFGPKMCVGGYSYGTGPFFFLGKLIQPFAAMRDIGRFGALAVFGLSVLAGFASKRIEDVVRRRFGARGHTTFTIALVAGICASISTMVPLPWCFRVPERSEMPQEYKWLASLPRQALIAEVPIGPWQDFPYMYYALFHGKAIINGSGWDPPYYNVAREALTKQVPSRDTAALLDEMGVDFLFCHVDQLDQDPLSPFHRLSDVKRNIENGGLEYFKLVERFDDCFVFQTNRGALGLPIGPLLSQRELVFECSGGDPALALPKMFPTPDTSFTASVIPSDRFEVIITFDRPTVLNGILADFHKRVPRPAHSVGIYIEGPSGDFYKQPFSEEPLLRSYRKALLGSGVKGLYEFSFPQVETRAILIKSGVRSLELQGSQLDIWGFAFKGNGASPYP